MSLKLRFYRLFLAKARSSQKDQKLIHVKHFKSKSYILSREFESKWIVGYGDSSQQAQI